jgi:hypothetical protein
MEHVINALAKVAQRVSDFPLQSFKNSCDA